jgi:hypothetical protein
VEETGAVGRGTERRGIVFAVAEEDKLVTQCNEGTKRFKLKSYIQVYSTRDLLDENGV